MELTRLIPTRHWGRSAAVLVALLAVLVALATGCERDEEPPAETEEADQADQADQAAGAEEDVVADPKGPPSIDNAGITEIPDDPELAKEGEELFASKGCTACHKADDRVVGPPLGGVTERREPEWLAKMIMHPEEMLQKDAMAKGMLAEYMTPMPNQQVTPEQARALIAYLATLEQ
ncbi:MAG: c-type cytochrome [Persicimonas sp.]